MAGDDEAYSGPTLGGIDVVVLAGGLGTRIRGVLGDTPKVLAPINDRPFLDHLLDRLAAQNAGRVVLALGHRADRVMEHLDRRRPAVRVVTVIEPVPLGTAGALRLACPLTVGKAVMVLNGDSWTDAPLGPVVAQWSRSGCGGAMVGVRVDDASRFGSLDISDTGELAGFVEKDPDRRGPGLINAGIYLFGRPLLDRLEAYPGPSLERDVLARLPAGTITVHVPEQASFVDIGTPESLAEAGSILLGKHRETP